MLLTLTKLPVSIPKITASRARCTFRKLSCISPNAMPRYVVLGGGVASGYAAKQFVEAGTKGDDILIITDEKDVAYERPALSKGYLLPEGGARLPGFHTCVGGGGEKQDPAWYASKGIKYMTSTRVTAADVAKKQLTLASGESVTYEKLIVATGCRPVYLTDFKTPGAELRGIHYLRSEVDAAELVAAMKGVKAAGGKTVVVGGGYIGMEVSAGMAVNGLQPTVVFPEPHFMPRLFTPQIAKFYEDFYTDKGVKLVKGAMVTGFEGKDGHVTSVKIKDSDGQIRDVEAQLVVVGVGARPNVDLFQGQLELAVGGIKVNGQLQSSDPDVYAVGDVAAFPLKIHNVPAIRQEHVVHARQSASHAVNAILGDTSDYDYLPYFYSRIFNLSWVFYGSSAGEPVHFGDYEKGKFGAYWVQDGKVVGAFLESGTADEVKAAAHVARVQPSAPPAEELAAQGISFASKL